jgi:hypothetical protein
MAQKGAEDGSFRKMAQQSQTPINTNNLHTNAKNRQAATAISD